MWHKTRWFFSSARSLAASPECTNNKFATNSFNAFENAEKSKRSKMKNRNRFPLFHDTTQSIPLFVEYKSWDVKHDRNNRKVYGRNEKKEDKTKYTHISCSDKRQIKLDKVFFWLVVVNFVVCRANTTFVPPPRCW